jgi:hypothetical protein
MYEAPLTVRYQVEMEAAFCAGSKDDINTSGNNNVEIGSQEGEDDFVVDSWD